MAKREQCVVLLCTVVVVVVVEDSVQKAVEKQRSFRERNVRVVGIVAEGQNLLVELERSLQKRELQDWTEDRQLFTHPQSAAVPHLS